MVNGLTVCGNEIRKKGTGVIPRTDGESCPVRLVLQGLRSEGVNQRVNVVKALSKIVGAAQEIDS